MPALVLLSCRGDQPNYSIHHGERPYTTHTLSTSVTIPRRIPPGALVSLSLSRPLFRLEPFQRAFYCSRGDFWFAAVVHGSKQLYYTRVDSLDGGLKLCRASCASLVCHGERPSSFRGAYETMLGFNSGILFTHSVPLAKMVGLGGSSIKLQNGGRASALPAVMANNVPGQAMVPQSKSVPAIHTQCPIPTLCYWFETDFRLGWWMVS